MDRAQCDVSAEDSVACPSSMSGDVNGVLPIVATNTCNKRYSAHCKINNILGRLHVLLTSPKSLSLDMIFVTNTTLVGLISRTSYSFQQNIFLLRGLILSLLHPTDIFQSYSDDCISNNMNMLDAVYIDDS